MLTAGQQFVVERGFPSHAYDLAVHRCLLELRRGEWATATDGLRRLVHGDADPGMLAVYSLPPYARLLARRGRPGRRAAAGAGLGSGPPSSGCCSGWPSPGRR